MPYSPDAITDAFANIDTITSATTGSIREQIEAVIADLDSGTLRVATKIQGDQSKWETHAWIKQAILLYFRLKDMDCMPEAGYPYHWDKIPLKTTGWKARQFTETAFRMVPGAVVRYGSFVAPRVVLMPSFVNIGAFVDEGCMIDTWATVGSCAQIGRNVHISGGAGIGGVLEPLQAQPTIIEDDCFIGARSEVAEGVIVEKGSVLSMGVYISASTPIINRKTGTIYHGRVPAGSVVVAGMMPAKQSGDPALYAAVIVKTVDSKTKSKVSINQLLRDAISKQSS